MKIKKSNAKPNKNVVQPKDILRKIKVWQKPTRYLLFFFYSIYSKPDGSQTDCIKKSVIARI